MSQVNDMAKMIPELMDMVSQSGLLSMANRRENIFKLAAAASAIALGLAFTSVLSSPSESTAWMTSEGGRGSLQATLLSGVSSMTQHLSAEGHGSTTKSINWSDSDCPDDEFCGACGDSAFATWSSAVMGLVAMALTTVTNYQRSHGNDDASTKCAGIVSAVVSFSTLLYAALNFAINCYGQEVDQINRIKMTMDASLGPGFLCMIFASVVSLLTAVVHALTPVLNSAGQAELAEGLTSKIDYVRSTPFYAQSQSYAAPPASRPKFASAPAFSRRVQMPTAADTMARASAFLPSGRSNGGASSSGSRITIRARNTVPSMSAMSLDEKCVNSVRFLAVDGVNKANSGHPGAPMGQAPMGYVLYAEEMNHNPKNPFWVNRDRFVLSSGHGCMLQYSLLHLCGYDDVTMDDLKSFRQWGSKTPGHPENFETRGVEVTTGPLGMGISNAVGLAMAERHLAAVYNKPGHEIVDHYTYTIAGDGCFQEGISHEACAYAGHLGLGKLIAFYDDNNITIDGETELSFTEDVAKRYEAYGWQVIEVEEGNTNVNAIRDAIKAAKAETNKPTLIKVKTVIGYGAPNKANSHDAHGAPLGADEAKATRDNLGWEYGEFEVPEDALSVYRETVPKGAAKEAEWNSKFEAYKAEFPDLGKQFEDCVINQKLPEGWEDALPKYTPEDNGLATRINSHKAINALATVIPGFMGGSADLAPSNMTLMASSGDFLKGQYENKNLRFGVREFGMGAIANALALHKSGLVPYCATFLIFSDYMRNAIRIAALSQAGTIFVMTHDSVALGEDGPTHQPIETIMSLRLIPQLAVIRPCDGNETSGAYRMAVLRSNGHGETGIDGRAKTFPTLLALTRQAMPNKPGSSINAVEKGAYAIDDCDGTPDVIIIATGSEVDLAIEAKGKLDGKKVRVVSMPCWEFFEDQPQSYKDEVLPKGVPVVSVEAGTTLGWAKYSDAQVGIDRFGVSAPGGTAMTNLGMTVDAVVDAAKSLM